MQEKVVYDLIRIWVSDQNLKKWKK